VKTKRCVRTLMCVCLYCSIIMMMFLVSGCSKEEEAPQPTEQIIRVKPTKSIPLPPKEGSTVYLSQAQFIYKTDSEGKKSPVPGPARLVMFTYSDKTWNREVMEDPDSNVFHKSQWFKPPVGEPGLLTIGANQAQLKLWRRSTEGWAGESLWNPSFGGKHDRLRDFEIADVTGDGQDDIVIATHDQGVVAVLTWEGKQWKSAELCRQKNMFVHEIETGDVDGDGIIEIFTTPSSPNKLDGTVQPGAIDMWKLKDGKWISRHIDILETRHAKEILCTTLPGESSAVLLSALEGEHIGGEQTGDTTRIRLYRIHDEIEKIDIVGLPGQLCRFLTSGDTDGNGIPEIIASTKDSGIWKLTPPMDTAQSEWKKHLIATGTSGFEHATFLADLDGDQKLEIIVASDNQRELRRYWFDGIRYAVDVIGKLKDDTITFNVAAYSLKTLGN
jgi:FG-GAP-like repeat